jgi:hypothetical protein
MKESIGPGRLKILHSAGCHAYIIFIVHLFCCANSGRKKFIDLTMRIEQQIFLFFIWRPIYRFSDIDVSQVDLAIKMLRSTNNLLHNS